MEDFITTLIAKVIEWLFIALLVMFIWNTSLMDIFNTSRIGYWDSFILVLFVHIIVPTTNVSIKKKDE